MNINQYFKEIEKEVDRCYEVAEKARSKGIDPVSKVEIPRAASLAERVIGLISSVYPQMSDDKIIKRILSLEKEHGKFDPVVPLIIAGEIAKEKFCRFKSHHEAIEAGIRTAVAYMTMGVVSSPIEGFVELKIKKTREGKDYFAPFFSGPIRSAGGTEAAFSLVVIDYLREVFGYARYDPTEEEVKRGIHECYEYHERVTNLQYLPSEKEIEFLMKHLPVQVSGDPSESKEVYNYKDLSRVETNYIRSGFALVIGEGIAQKAPKILKRINLLKKKGFKMSGWDWLEEFVRLKERVQDGQKVSDAGSVYIKDIVAGRPVFSYPGRSGGFRLRYGRSRNTGYSALGLNPATMAVTDNFIAVGTQLKIEKPTKGCVIAPCDGIDGPIVKLSNGSVKKFSEFDEVKKSIQDISEVLYLGDVLVPYGDFSNRNHKLEKQGYIEQYWLEELKERKCSSELFPDFEKAVSLSEKCGVSLHPDYIYYWSQISREEFLFLIDWFARAKLKDFLVLPYSKIDRERFAKAKRALELIGCEHEVSIENVVLSKKNSKAILFNLGINSDSKNLEKEIDELIRKIKEFPNKNVLEIVNLLCDCEVRDKAGVFIGSRMGRPEKAKLRKLTGSPHVLFPVGAEGGRLRSFQSALEARSVRADFPVYFCEECREERIYPSCEKCRKTCKKMNYCFECDKLISGECDVHGRTRVYGFRNRRIDIGSYFNLAKRNTGLRIEELPVAVKGVRGTSSKDHDCENLAKGFLRAKYNLHVNKDGSVRYDISEMPLTHFKAKEIGTSVEKLKALGYDKDIFGKELKNDEQVLEIFPHDVVLPSCPQTLDEKADDVFFNLTNFVDDELEKIYCLDRFFKVKKKEDLVGVLIGCIAPHNCAAVVGRIIGFSRIQGFLASPYIHAAMRRDCDGDEAAVMLLMDLLVNFSKKYLPSHRGGTQDSPLVLNTHIRAGEVDDMIFDFDVSKNIPLELYRAAEEGKSPYEVRMEQISNRLGTDKEFVGVDFSYDVSDINDAPLCSSYKSLPTMQEKVESQMLLCKKIRAVDASDVARLTIERHFIRDIRGNLRKFSMQVFRCVGCNEKYRRVPLQGKCRKCGGKIIFTISEGSIVKYLAGALELARKYEVSPYLLECLELTEKNIESIFGKDKEKQENLSKWFS